MAPAQTGWSGGTIHTDIQKGFIRAEIISFADFIAAGGETQARHANKMRLEMKPYVMQDHDLPTSGSTSKRRAPFAKDSGV